MVIAIDFDGTCVTHDFPNVGKEIGSVSVLKKLVDAGHKLILFTMRSDIDNPTSDNPDILEKSGEYLTDAVNWFDKHNIPLWGIQTNPEQSSWTHSPKAYAHLYIDDASIGCPLLYDAKLSNRPFVDWLSVECILSKMGIINNDGNITTR